MHFLMVFGYACSGCYNGIFCNCLFWTRNYLEITTVPAGSGLRTNGLKFCWWNYTLMYRCCFKLCCYSDCGYVLPCYVTCSMRTGICFFQFKHQFYSNFTCFSMWNRVLLETANSGATVKWFTASTDWSCCFWLRNQFYHSECFLQQRPIMPLRATDC
jgi:hypothetical protein